MSCLTFILAIQANLYSDSVSHIIRIPVKIRRKFFSFFLQQCQFLIIAFTGAKHKFAGFSARPQLAFQCYLRDILMSRPLGMQSTLNFRQTAGSEISDSVPDGQSVDAANLSTMHQPLSFLPPAPGAEGTAAAR